jgi:hypothetical protein
MCAFRRVPADRAGPGAVGILVPPARRTFLIVRARTLSFDLLLLSEARGTTFRDLDRERAERAAEALCDLLREPAPDKAVRIQTTESDDGATLGFQLRVHIGPFHFIACNRRPGQPYKALEFSAIEAANAAGGEVFALLCPVSMVEQEIYLNTRNFQP